MTILTVGIDLAKNVFAAHGVGESGHPELVRSTEPGEWPPTPRRCSHRALAGWISRTSARWLRFRPAPTCLAILEDRDDLALRVPALLHLPLPSGWNRIL